MVVDPILGAGTVKSYIAKCCHGWKPDFENLELCSFMTGDYSGGKCNMLMLKKTGNAASKIA
jgi:hypothetical protein